MNEDLTRIQTSQSGSLPGEMGFDWIAAQEGYIRGQFLVEKRHLAPTGYLHAATVVALADSACGFGCTIVLPKGATGFTTVELKANFIGTARHGRVSCEARLIHGGRSTQVWDATVTGEETGNAIALFRCTQMILYPPEPGLRKA